MNRVLLILKLRWMLFKNSLRSRSGCSELLSQIFLALLLVPLDLVLSASIGAAVYLLYGRPLFVPAVTCILAGVTVAWQLIPIMTASLGNDADIEKFRQYPLSARDLLAIDVALGAFDPVALLAYPALAAILVACAARSAAAVAISLISLILFAAFNIVLSRYMHRLISALLSNRKRREIIAILVFLLLLAPQALVSLTSERRNRYISQPGPSSSEKIDSTRRAVATAGEYLAWLPPGLAARTLGAGIHRFTITDCLALLSAAAFAFALGWLEYARLIRDYYGRPAGFPAQRALRRSSKSAAPAGGLPSDGSPPGELVQRAARSTSTNVAPAILSRFGILDKAFAWVPPASSAILEKELRYFYRSPRAFVICLGPLLGATIFLMPTRLGSIAASADNYRLAIVILYSVLLDTQFFCNAFGFDWHGAKLYFMAPIKGQSVLIGKNLAALCVMGVQLVAVTLLFRLFTGSLKLAAVANGFFAVAISAPLSLTLGNYLSVLYPRAVDFSKVYGRSYSNVSQFAILIDLPLMAVVAGAGPVLGLIFDSKTVTYAVFIVESVLGLAVYITTVGNAGRLLEGRAEGFLQALVTRK